MSYKFTKGQQTFINSVAAKTGLNPRVVGAWVYAEMNGGAARSREAAGNHNWLNIAYFDSGPGSITKNRTWRTPESAAQATADFLKGKRFGASSGIRRILRSAGKSADAQIQAIANSGWASSGYEGGSTLRNLYGGMKGLPKVVPMQGASAQIAPNGGTQYDPSARQAALATYIQQRNRPGALLTLAQSLKSAEASVPSAQAPIASPRRSGGSADTSASGTATFDGKPVAAWIKPALEYARKHGWNGTVTSGFRSYADQQRIYNSGVRPAARPGSSNHEGSQFPRGAVDVSNASGLAKILRNSPWASKLVWAGAKDPVHFSHPHGGGY